MLEINVNVIAPVVFALIYGPAGYWRDRRVGVPIAPAFDAAARATMMAVLIGVAYGLSLNWLRIQWDSWAGYGLGIIFGIVAVTFMIVARQRQRGKDWQ